MATPMTAQQFVDALKKEGVKVSESFKGWRTHERDDETGRTFGPVNGIVIHHTAGRDSLNLCIKGTSSLPGPLCHTHLSKTGVATMISAGRANHAGGFTQNAHDAVVRELKNHPRPSGPEVVDGNDHYYGIEIENLGNGSDEYPAEQYDAAVRWAAAICRFHGWTAQSIIGHKEGTTRKIDPKGPVEGRGDFDMDEFRADVQAVLDGKPKPAPKEPVKEEPKPEPKPSTPSWDGKSYPGASAFKLDRTHPAVEVLGKRLIAHGFAKHNDGNGYQPGPRFTKYDLENVRDFQHAQGWSGKDADGYPGPSTWQRLMAKPKPKTQLRALKSGVKPGARHSQVKDLQRYLIKAGYGPIPGAVTDYYGPATQRAVARFHNANPKYRSKSYDPAIGPTGYIALQKKAGVR